LTDFMWTFDFDVSLNRLQLKIDWSNENVSVGLFENFWITVNIFSES